MTEYFPKFDCAVNSQKVFVCDADAKSLSYEFHLPISFTLSLR